MQQLSLALSMDPWHPAEFHPPHMMRFVIHCTFPCMLLLRCAPCATLYTALPSAALGTSFKPQELYTTKHTLNAF